MSEPRPLAPVPSLDQLSEHPEVFDSLARLEQAALLERAEVLAARLRAKVLAARTPAEPAVSDRAVVLEEARGLLGYSKDYLYRHWEKLGGYKADDGRLRINMSTIQRHLQHRGCR